MSLIEELKRRDVIRVATAYVVTAWLIIQVVETLFPIYDLSNDAIRYVTTALAVGFIPVVVLSWVFEWTPQGIRKETEANKESSAKTTRRMDKLITLILVIAVSYFAADKFIIDKPDQQSATETSSEFINAVPAIAVLAFKDMSKDKDQQYMSDGVAEEILNLLSKVPNLRVISRSSSFSYKNKEQTLPSIANELNVTYVLEGSVRKSGNKIRITTKLVDAVTDTQRWSETYDRELESIFEIQDDIAAQVVNQLRISVLGELPVSRRVDQDAYTLVLKARYLWNRRSTGDEEEALVLYQKAVEIDPNYGPAWTGLSVAYSVAGVKGEINIDEARKLSRQAINKAVAIDPNDPETRIRLGQSYRREKKYAEMFVEYEKAMELAPNNPLVLAVTAGQFSMQGQIDRVVELYEAASEIDPLGAIYYGNKAASLISFHRFDEAEIALEKGFILNANPLTYNFNQLNILMHRKQFQKVQEILKQLPEDDRLIPQYAMLYASLGQTENFDDLMNKLKNAPDWKSKLDVAKVYAFLGENDLAFEWLEKAQPEGWPWWLAYDVYTRNLTSDPRWEPFVDSLDWPWEYEY